MINPFGSLFGTSMIKRAKNFRGNKEELPPYDGLVVHFEIQLQKKKGQFVLVKPKEVDRRVRVKIMEVVDDNPGYEFDKNEFPPHGPSLIKVTLYFKKAE